MLSFVSSFRAAARRQSRTLPVARAVSTVHAQVDTVEAEPIVDAQNMEQLSDFVHDIAEEQETLAAGSSAVESFVFDKGAAEVRGMRNPLYLHVARLMERTGVGPSINVKGSPVLKGFVPNQVRSASYVLYRCAS